MSIPGPHFELPYSGNPQVAPSESNAPAIDEEISRLLLRSAERLVAALEPHVAEAALNQARLQVLEALDGHRETGCSQTQLADQLLLSESNLSTLVERMGDDGLVTRQRSHSDRRKTVIRLTAGGALALERAVASRRDALRQLLAALDEPEKGALSSLLRRILERLEQHLVRAGRRRLGAGHEAPGASVGRRASPPVLSGSLDPTST